MALPWWSSQSWDSSTSIMLVFILGMCLASAIRLEYSVSHLSYTLKLLSRLQKQENSFLARPTLKLIQGRFFLY
ncbi:hypothetical protein B0O99DRAFT_299731 [Bisporella sp. PMI_857]|nr:hypothetical protein B0O99DRAFT_299731 [Bisporella sp. PMI_857]